MKREQPDITTINIRPEVNILSVLRHLNYKAWFALAEFIDNSLQSYIANRSRLKALHGEDFCLKVDIKFEPEGVGRFIITDNAAGITAQDFPRAFRAAEVPADRSGLSEFGMGMKSAACWFAQRWAVRTKALGEDVEREISFDINHIVDNRIESLGTTTRPVDSRHHYTVVTLTHLHHPPIGRTLGKIKEHLASIYRVFLQKGELELAFNSGPLTYPTPKVLTCIPYASPGVPKADAAPVEWRKEIKFDFGNGLRVTGFAALREKASTSHAGFALFRRARLIEGSADETYRPAQIFKQTNSYRYQRLFGELHLEGFQVSHTKDGFRWDEDEEAFLSCLEEHLQAGPLNLFAQAENYRALPQRKTIDAQAKTATESVATYLTDEVAPLLQQETVEPESLPGTPDEIQPVLPQACEKTVSFTGERTTWTVTLRTSLDPTAVDWLSVARGEDLHGGRSLTVDISLAHPFSTRFIGTGSENIELFLRVATAAAISLLLHEDTTGEPPSHFLYHFNALLRGALSKPTLEA